MSDIPVIEFVTPLPGFPDLTRFALVELAEDGSLAALRSLEEPGVRFLVMPPSRVFPEYAPVIDDETAARLEISGPDEVLLLVVVNAGGGVDEATANLLAPVLVNVATRRAQQIVLDDPALSLAVPLVAA